MILNLGLIGDEWQLNEASGEKAVYSSGNHMIAFGYEYGTQKMPKVTLLQFPILKTISAL